MQKYIFYSLILMAVVFSSGCAQNGYSKFYTDFSHKYSSLDSTTFQRLQSDQQPKLMAGTNLQQDSFSMQANGYVPIGYSSFQGRLEAAEKALSQAKKVGATHVLIYSSSADSSVSTAYRPEKVPVTNQSDKKVETSVTNTSGYSRSRGYTQAASYWIERERWDFGAYVEALPPLLKQQAGLENGCSLAIVVAGSAADRAGLVSGDIVVQFFGRAIESPEAFQMALEENTAAQVPILVYRDGEYLEKVVALGIENTQLAARLK